VGVLINTEGGGFENVGERENDRRERRRLKNV